MTASSLQQAYNKAIGLINNNQFPEAESFLKQYITMNGGDLNCERLLGIVFMRQEKHDQAIKIFKSICERVKGAEIAIKDLIEAYNASGEKNKTITLLRDTAKQDAASIPLWYMLGDALVDIGRPNEALKAYSTAEILDPLRKENNAAKQAMQQNNMPHAAHIYKQIIGSNPNNIEALTGLAIYEMEAGNLTEARNLLNRAQQISKFWPLAYQVFGDVLMRSGHFSEAKEVFEQALEVSPIDPRTWAMYGIALDYLFKHNESIAALKRSLKLNKQQPEVLMMLGNVYRVLGDADKSVRYFKQYIEMTPYNGGAYWALADLKTYTFSSSDIQALEEARKDDTSPTTHYSQIHFALAAAYEQQGKFDEAFICYEKGNLIQRTIVNYDKNAMALEVDNIIKGYPEKFLSQAANKSGSSKAPIFILGMPRTGSTLLEQILASHSAVDATMELPFIGNYVAELYQHGDKMGGYPEGAYNLSPNYLKKIAEKYLISAEQYRHGAKHFIDKMPNNFKHIGLIHLMFPDAKIIDMQRNPMDTCLSLFKHHFSTKQPFCYDLNELGHYYQLYQKQMDHWNTVLPGKILTIQYEDLVSSPEEEIRRVLNYCELDFEEACLTPHKTKRAIRTASSEQVRHPITTANLSHWKTYEEQLAPLKVALSD